MSRKRTLWSPADMREAVYAVTSGFVPLPLAAEIYNIPKGTLYDYVRNNKTKPFTRSKAKYYEESEEDETNEPSSTKEENNNGNEKVPDKEGVEVTSAIIEAPRNDKDRDVVEEKMKIIDTTTLKGYEVPTKRKEQHDADVSTSESSDESSDDDDDAEVNIAPSTIKETVIDDRTIDTVDSTTPEDNKENIEIQNQKVDTSNMDKDGNENDGAASVHTTSEDIIEIGSDNSDSDSTSDEDENMEPLNLRYNRNSGDDIEERESIKSSSSSDDDDSQDNIPEVAAVPEREPDAVVSHKTWLCYACKIHKVDDMRQCFCCFKWYHEACIGIPNRNACPFRCLECRM